MARGVRRSVGKESFWRRLVRGQASSGLSVRGWCRRHGQRESAFYWWRRELARRDAEQAAFVPVQVGEEEKAGGAGQIEIILGRQRRVRLSGQVDRRMLGDVLAVMEGRGC